jgi:hypothetical protein
MLVHQGCTLVDKEYMAGAIFHHFYDIFGVGVPRVRALDFNLL